MENRNNNLGVNVPRKKYVGNWSNASCNGIVGGYDDNNAARLEKDLRSIAKGNGGGNWFIKVWDDDLMDYIPYKEGFVK